MTRKEGIIKRWQIDYKAHEQPPEEIFTTEYTNYVEQCYYCYETPLGLDQWLNERINPYKDK